MSLQYRMVMLNISSSSSSSFTIDSSTAAIKMPQSEHLPLPSTFYSHKCTVVRRRPKGES
jgi:hypothetical protein